MENDITKCVNEKCKEKMQCLRYLIKPGVYQSYAQFVPDKKNKCNHKIKWGKKKISDYWYKVKK